MWKMFGVGLWSPLHILEGPVVSRRTNYCTDQSTIDDSPGTVSWCTGQVQVVTLDPLDPWFKSPLSTPVPQGPPKRFASCVIWAARHRSPLCCLRPWVRWRSNGPRRKPWPLVDDAIGRRVRRGGRPYRVIPPCCAMIRDPRVKYSL